MVLIIPFLIWRGFVYVWTSIDIYFMGSGGWSIWSKTCYISRHCLSVTFIQLQISIRIFLQLSYTYFLIEILIIRFRVIFNTLFGLSLNYWMAISSRFLLGSMSTLLGPIMVLFYCLWLFGRSFDHYINALKCLDLWFNLLVFFFCMYFPIKHDQVSSLIRHMQLKFSVKNTKL